MKYEMMFVDEPWSLNYVVYKNFLFNGSNETVISMVRKYCIATFVYEEDARKYCELRNKKKENIQPSASDRLLPIRSLKAV